MDQTADAGAAETTCVCGEAVQPSPGWARGWTHGSPGRDWNHDAEPSRIAKVLDEAEQQAAALPRPSAATIITMAGELPPRTFRVWLDAHDG